MEITIIIINSSFQRDFADIAGCYIYQIKYYFYIYNWTSTYKYNVSVKNTLIVP